VPDPSGSSSSADDPRPSRLRAARLAAGLSQAAVAARLGVTPGYVGMVERGEKRPTASFWVRVARALDADPAAFAAPPVAPDPPPDERGARLRQARQAAGLTATALAKVLGVSRSHLSAIEAGRFGASDEVWSAAARALGRLPDEFAPSIPAPAPAPASPIALVRTVAPGVWVPRTRGERAALEGLGGPAVVVPAGLPDLLDRAAARSVGVAFRADLPAAAVGPREDGSDGYPDRYRRHLLGWALERVGTAAKRPGSGAGYSENAIAAYRGVVIAGRPEAEALRAAGLGARSWKQLRSEIRRALAAELATDAAARMARVVLEGLAKGK
jgi:transcriptional regulator with XRE-family HTH domain